MEASSSSDTPSGAGPSSSASSLLDGATIPSTPSKSHPVSRLPAEFFQPPESFDAVSHMLDSLPAQLTEPFLEAQISQTQVVLDSISSQLSARVMRSYGAFVHGMAQVRTT